MAWLRIDDRFRTHPKMHKAGLAGWLAFCGICYCREHLTDGVIPREAVQTLAPGLTSPYKHAAKLVEIGLWHEHLDGFQVHDFLDWNPSRQDVMSLRDKERDKKRTQRGHNGDSHASARIGAGDAGLGSLSGSEVLGSGSSEEKIAPETTAIARVNPHSRPENLVNAHEQRRHGMHAWCDWKRGLCVPYGINSEFKLRLGGEDADRRLLAWYPKVVESYGSQPVGDDVFAFWRNEFAGWVGTVTHAPSQNTAKTARTLSAARNVIERQERQHG